MIFEIVNNIYKENRAVRLFFSHSYGQVVTIASNFILPVILLRYWGVADFGVWVTIIALSQFFLYADLGLISASSNDMCMRNWQSDVHFGSFFFTILKEVYKRVFFFFLLAGPASALTAAMVGGGSRYQVGLACFFLTASSFSMVFINLLCALRRYQKKNEIGIFLSNTARLLDFLIIFGSVFFGGDYLMVSIVMLISRAILSLFVLRRIYKEIELNCTHVFDLAELGIIGLGFAKIGIGQSISTSGIVYLISMMFGVSSAGVFSALRTISRLPMQALVLVAQSVGPDLTDCFFSGDYQGLLRRARWMTMFSVALSSAYLLIFGYFGSLALDVTYGLKGIDSRVIVWMCIGSFFYITSQVAIYTLSFINKTSIVGKVSVSVTLMCCGALLFLAKKFDLLEVVELIAIFDIFTCIAVYAYCWHIKNKIIDGVIK